MDADHAPTLTEQFAAIEEWWRLAGVDHEFGDEAVAWLKPHEEDAPRAHPDTQRDPAPAPLAEPAANVTGGDRANWPQDLESFHAWWLSEPTLDEGGTHPRIAARGPKAADLLILIPMPEECDTQALLSGPQGRLLASAVQAMGMDDEAIYWAAALPRHQKAPDWRRHAASGLGEVLLHHLALAAPQRLLVLGRDILPLLGHDPAQGPPDMSETSIQGSDGIASLPTLAHFGPEAMLAQPRARAGLWRRWLDWTDEAK